MVSVFFDITDVPADFANADEASLTVRTRGVGVDDSPIKLLAQLFESDETTPLSDEVECVTAAADTGFTNHQVDFTGLNTTAGKTVWDAARIRFRWADGNDPANLNVTINGTTAELTWDASDVQGVVDYQVFRRTPQTGERFDPTSDTPIATGITDLFYDDVGLDPGDYDWQVFGRIPT